jgi:hypothetical protein
MDRVARQMGRANADCAERVSDILKVSIFALKMETVRITETSAIQ